MVFQTHCQVYHWQLLCRENLTSAQYYSNVHLLQNKDTSGILQTLQKGFKYTHIHNLAPHGMHTMFIHAGHIHTHTCIRSHLNVVYRNKAEMETRATGKELAISPSQNAFQTQTGHFTWIQRLV